MSLFNLNAVTFFPSFVRWSADPRAKEFPSLVLAHPKLISDFEFCPHVRNGNLLATTSADEMVKLWDLRTEEKEIKVPKIEFSQEMSMGVINSVKYVHCFIKF